VPPEHGWREITCLRVGRVLLGFAASRKTTVTFPKKLGSFTPATRSGTCSACVAVIAKSNFALK
jgi:hypothetical protein